MTPIRDEGERRFELPEALTPEEERAILMALERYFVAESPRPASIWANNPPVECPITAGFCSSLPITSAVWSATCFSVFLARTSGFARASSTVSGSSGQSGVSGA